MKGDKYINAVNALRSGIAVQQLIDCLDYSAFPFK